MKPKDDENLTIFVDTNIALHYLRLDQINWQEVVQSKKVKIVVCAVVLTELDKNKVENSSKKIRKRANEYGAWLLKKYDAPSLNDHTKIVFYPNEPLLDFAVNSLDKQNFDVLRFDQPQLCF